MTNCGFNFDTTYTLLPEYFFTKITPDPVASPDVVILNNALAESMHLDFSSLNDNAQAALFSGNQLPEGLAPFAQAYAGHQYGHFTLLGDGRALVWGEHLIPDGTRFDIQFKGSGPTPYSRRGDGKAVLGPMLREYIISEAMHHLGIPTTRSLAVTSTGEHVFRERALPGAVLTRVASSHIRVGTFEYAATSRDRGAISSILDYTIQRHYPDLLDHGNKALALIQAIMEKQADLIVDWMRVGFIHGVMNTDNMALSGETIDYGPCAFMDNYDPNTVFSSIDQTGRYAYANQPKIAQWNLARLAETLLPLINDDINVAIEVAEDTIKQFPDNYQRKWLAMMRAKLGLVGAFPTDETLISDLLDWMRANNADYTNTFLELSQAGEPKGQCYQDQTFAEWYARWQNRLNQTAQTVESSLSLMKNSNPVVIPRNHKVEEALQAAHDQDFKPLRALLGALATPYQDDAKLQAYQLPPKPSERVLQTFCGT